MKKQMGILSLASLFVGIQCHTTTFKSVGNCMILRSALQLVEARENLINAEWFQVMDKQGKYDLPISGKFFDGAGALANYFGEQKIVFLPQDLKVFIKMPKEKVVREITDMERTILNDRCAQASSAAAREMLKERDALEAELNKNFGKE